jgi:hypothetical protein
MLTSLSERTRNLLAQSLPFIEHKRDSLVDGVSGYMKSVTSPDPDHHSEMVAMMLAELLIGRSRHLVLQGPFREADEIRHEHSSLGIEGRHYSRFGDALVPVIRDILGPNAPREIAGAWCDAFWAMIRDVQATGQMIEA